MSKLQQFHLIKHAENVASLLLRYTGGYTYSADVVVFRLRRKLITHN